MVRPTAATAHKNGLFLCVTSASYDDLLNVRNGRKADIAAITIVAQFAAMRWKALAAMAMLAASGCQTESEHYANSCSEPLANWGRETDGLYELRPAMPIYLTADGSLLWNQTAISDDILRQRMLSASGQSVRPQIILEIAPAADCRRVRTIRSVMDQTPICNEGLCSEGSNHEDWPLRS